MSAYNMEARPSQSYPYVPVLHDDVEKGLNSESHLSFAEKAIRDGFIRKVFGILSVQLAVTFAISTIFVASQSAKAFLAANSWLLILSFVASFAFLMAFAFSENARRQHPTNLLLLGGFTVAESILVGAVSAQYDTAIVVQALALTAVITVSLCVYALRTKNDITSAGGWLFCMLMTLLFAGFLRVFTSSPALNIAISSVGALLFAAYIVYDVQLLVGGQHKFSLSPEEYVFGAVAIYLDVINLFLHLLRLLNEINQR